MASSVFVHCNIVASSSTTQSSSATKLHNPSPTIKKPNQISIFQNPSKWASISIDVETHIDRAIFGHEPASVFEPMHHLTFAPPRSMAPALCIAACEAVGGQGEHAIAAASVFHLMHAAAFTHEKLPLSDRPMPKTAVPHVFGANIELLTGDGISPFGYELLSKSQDTTNISSEQILRVVIEISRVTGSQGLVDGQYLQMKCMGSDSDEALCEVGWINRVCEKKEGGFYACGAACGAILGGGTDEEIEILRSYGFYVGMMHGMMLDGIGMDEEKWKVEVEGFRSLALKELESLKGKNIETVSCLLDDVLELWVEFRL